MVLVVRAKVGALLVEHLDVNSERGEGERVEREDSLRVLGLAVRLDDLAIDHDARDLDRQGSGVQVEQRALGSRQLTAAHS